jgi:hypothetical protein
MEENAMKKMIAVLFALACLSAAVAQDRTGEVRGIVVDPQGNPVAAATVRAHYDGAGPVFKSVPEAQTDQSGQFTLSNVPLGDSVLVAMKEDDGYPNPFWAFYSRRQPVRVTLSSGAPRVDSIQLMLEPKAAALVGTISDAVSGEPVGASIHMWRAGKEDDFLDQGVSGQYRILVPADTAVRFSVRAPGYLEWFNGGATEASRTASMVILSGHSQALHIKLARAAK